MNHKGDFLSLLKNADNIHLDSEGDAHQPLQSNKKSEHNAFQLPLNEKLKSGSELQIPEATTVVAMRYKEGIIIAGGPTCNRWYRCRA